MKSKLLKAFVDGYWDRDVSQYISWMIQHGRVDEWYPVCVFRLVYSFVCMAVATGAVVALFLGEMVVLSGCLMGIAVLDIIERLVINAGIRRRAQEDGTWEQFSKAP